MSMLTEEGRMLLDALRRAEAAEAERCARETREDAERYAKRIFKDIMRQLRKKGPGSPCEFVLGYADFKDSDGDWTERNNTLGRLLGISIRSIPKVPYESEDRLAPQYKYELTRAALRDLLAQHEGVPADA